MRIGKLAGTCLYILSLSWSANSLANPVQYAHPSFSSGEHVSLGDSIKLNYDLNSPGQAGTKLHLPNGLVLTLGEAISMGDFYGILGQPISQGSTLKKRKQRFLSAFNTFSTSPSTLDETGQILAVIYSEQNDVATGLHNGEQLEDIYSRISTENDRQWNCITGGGCDDTWYLHPGRYLLLAAENYDHFSNQAWLAYEAGHAAALDQALLARATQSQAALELAYAMDGFALHFLSDRFAAGHIRSPRVELHNQVKPAIIGDLLTSYMHDEDNKYGLQVHNQADDHWVAYGDHYYYEESHSQAREQINQTLQASVNQIFTAYTTGVKADIDEIKKHLPQTQTESTKDIAPLFYWDEHKQQLYRRVDLNNPYDYHWTTQWWGWATLIELNKNKSVSILDQAKLAISSFANEALALGIIKDKSIVDFINDALERS